MTTKPKTFFFVTVPAPYQMQLGKDPKTQEAVTRDFGLDALVVFLADTDDHFTKSAAGFRQANRLVEQFSDCNEGEVIPLHPEDYHPLLAAAENPSGGMPGIKGADAHGNPLMKPVGRGLQPVIDALADATQTDPRPVEEDEPPTPALPAAALPVPEPTEETPEKAVG